MDYYRRQTYYDVLGVESNATVDNIEKAKNRLKFGGPDDRAPFSMWGKIDEAYSVLSDSEKRAKYDKHLKEETEEIAQSPTITNNPNPQSIVQDNENVISQNEIVPKLKIIGKEVVLALPTAIIATINIIKKLNKKYKLAEQPGNKITEVMTEEANLIELYRRKLDEKIDIALTQYHPNYDLTIDKLRYENYISLLKKLIEMKENQVVKKGGLLKYKLQLTALRNQLKIFEVSLEKVNDKINDNSKVQKLSKIYKNIEEVDEKIEQINQSSSRKIMTLKKLQVRRNNLINKKNLKIQKIKSNREYYAIFKDSFISAHSLTENFVDNLMVPIEMADEKSR